MEEEIFDLEERIKTLNVNIEHLEEEYEKLYYENIG